MSICEGNEECTSCASDEVEKNDSLCTKCKVLPSVVIASQDESLCKLCLFNSLLIKVKSVVNKYKLIEDGDSVLLAFSGGFSSRAAINLLQSIQCNSSASKVVPERGKIEFKLGIAHVDERIISGVDNTVAEEAIESIKAICLNSKIEPIIRPLEYSLETSAFVSNATETETLRQELQEVIAEVKDVTGKEDLVENLRLRCLSKIARENGFTKIALGLNTSRMAVKVISSTSKGQGFSIPSMVAYSNTQHDFPIILPLRDCSGRLLSINCQLFGWKTVFSPWLDTKAAIKGHSINSLAEKFVKSMQEENWSRESTIVRTAAKLRPRIEIVAIKCPVCLNQVPENGISYLEMERNTKICQSCSFQIIGDGNNSGVENAKLLNFVKDFLLE